MKDITAGGILGKVVAHMHVIEFQKRGLPHAHLLVILAERDRPVNSAAVDQVVCAELPPDPNAANDEQSADQRRRLEKVVVNNMIHGPCGKLNPKSPCMENGKCTKQYPKQFNKNTVVDKDSYYATYRRRSPEDGGRTIVFGKSGRIVDNSWVVPYNPFLSLRYNCHINVEVCTSPKAAKYLYKYVTKGNDRAMVASEVAGQRDEITEYEDLRSVGSSEAAWHLLAFPISKRHPAVAALRIHTEEQQQIVFDEGTEEAAMEIQRETELTAFFKLNEKLLNSANVQVNELPTYVDMPKKFTFNKVRKEWLPRKSNTEDVTIGRIHSVNPLAGETFYLRILLHMDHCKGKTSFKDMLTLPDGRVCKTYQEVCSKLGLLADDKEWQMVLEEATNVGMCSQIRELFVIILMFCQPENPRELFDKFADEWVDDFGRKAMSRGVEIEMEQLRTMLLLDLEMRLQSFEKSLQDFGLPVPTAEEIGKVDHIACTEPVVIREEKDFNVEDIKSKVIEIKPQLTLDQRTIFDTVLHAVESEQQLLLFIDARGGCGKTFLLNGILDAIRSLDPRGCVALAMATTGIAASLLHLGRTFHSRLKAPLIPTEESTLQISYQSSLATLVRMAKILLIDESTMLDRFQLEAMDRTLRDLMDEKTLPFGGKSILLAGDFRQCLPVVPGATRAETVTHCLNQSKLWVHFQVRRLSVNMRVRASGDPELELFDQWTLSIGDGIKEDGIIPIPRRNLNIITLGNERESMSGFCDLIFPELKDNIGIEEWLEGRSILAPTNKEVDRINFMMENKLPGNSIYLLSADTLDNPNDAFRFNTEYLNSLDPSGIPPHLLHLKPGMPLILMRNLNPRLGLCNGTRMIFEAMLGDRLLQCRVFGSKRKALIPRITLIPKPGEYPFQWRRRQFPVRSAFATTINKAQGQSLKFVGIWLQSQVFSHGQLYVACSRVSKPSDLKFAILDDNTIGLAAQNVVYHEILLQ